MKHFNYGRMQALLYETKNAYDTPGGVINADYAEFASMAIADFRRVLRNPKLKRTELIAMIRKNMPKARTEDGQLWPIVMAKYMGRSANTNAYETVH